LIFNSQEEDAKTKFPSKWNLLRGDKNPDVLNLIIHYSIEARILPWE